ncbi:MAG: glycogen synthase GlgA [Vicinamibacteria bacterium]
MNIVFVSSEVDPLAKTGGLADVVSSLALALQRLRHRVSIVMPFYDLIAASGVQTRDAGLVIQVPLEGRVRQGAVWTTTIDGVPVYLLRNPGLYDRGGIYGSGGQDFPDNAIRFAFLSRGALEIAKAARLEPDVFHIHDWETALLPVYRDQYYRNDRFIGQAGVVLTIHNLVYQGLFSREILSALELPSSLFRLDALEFFGQVNLLKGGIVFSEKISTVSPTYAREIQRRELGAGLDGLLRYRSADLVGILNGIDTSLWNPGTDKALWAPYTSSGPEGKATNKAALQEKLGLRVSAETPLIAAIGRLDPQKGFDLILAVTPRLLRAGAQLVLLGAGARAYLDAFGALAKEFPHQLSINQGFQADLGRQIYAGADIFLMPSRYEPCGLGQLLAYRYGAIPVVRRTGGLADTVDDFDESPDEGHGFVFEPFEAEALGQTLDRALAHFRDTTTWGKLVRRAMRADFSWKSSATAYLELYEAAKRRAAKQPGDGA